MRVLRKEEFHAMPWKNGGGTTIEIAVFPPSASISDFNWRVSMAQVASNGPFSCFPDIDRTLSILEGEGVELNFEGTSSAILKSEDAPLSFAADIDISARLLGGPVRDLNVMTRRGHFTHQVTRLKAGDTGTIRAGAGIRLLISNAPWTIAAPYTEMRPHDLLILENSTAEIAFKDKDASLFMIDILTVENSVSESV